MTDSLNEAARSIARLEQAVDFLEARLGELEDALGRAQSAKAVNERLSAEREALAEALAIAEERVRDGVRSVAVHADAAINPQRGTR